MKKLVVISALLASFLQFVGCRAEALSPVEVLANPELYFGKHIRIQARLRAGLRCRLETEDKKWRTYCRDCQICRGPFVVDLPEKDRSAYPDWPMVLGGTYNQRDIRCKGPLNKVECYPFEPGHTYILEGLFIRTQPPKLFIDNFQEVKTDTP